MRIGRAAAGGLAVALATLAALLVLAGCSHRQQPTPVPTPGVTGNPLGSKWDWSQQASLRLARRMSGGSTFFEVERCDVEPRPGEYRWSRVDSVVRRASAMGYRMMLKIRAGDCYGGRRDPGLRRDPTEATAKTPSLLPENVAGYRDFVRTLVRRYSAMGVHEYAVENEIDTANFWAGTYDDFAVLARAAVRAIHDSDPHATIADPGLSSTAYGVVLAATMVRDRHPEQALQFYREYYRRRQEGGASRFPAVTGVAQLQRVLDSPMAKRALSAAATITEMDTEHVFGVYQLHFYESPDVLPQVLSWIRRKAKLPVQAWEVGVAWPGNSDAQVQAADTAKLVAILLGAGVRPIVYLPLAPTPEPGKAPVFRGLAGPDGTVTPAGRAFQKLARLLDAGTVHKAHVTGLAGIAISDKAGTTEFLVWSDRSQPVRLRTGTAAQSVTGTAAGTAVGTAPVFIHRDAPLVRAQKTLVAR